MDFINKKWNSKRTSQAIQKTQETKNKQILICKVCKKEFEKDNSARRKLCCSGECSKINSRIITQKWKAENKNADVYNSEIEKQRRLKYSDKTNEYNKKWREKNTLKYNDYMRKYMKNVRNDA